MVTSAGRLIERYDDTPYGQRTVYSHGWHAADIDQDGDVDLLDESHLNALLDEPDDGSESTPIERGHFNRRADLNGDGQIDADDMALLQAELGQQHPTADWHVRTPRFMSFRNADLVTPAAFIALCPFGHQGLLHDEELAPGGSAPGAGGGLVHNRARTLHPGVGRFMQRDPLNQNMPGGGYHDGMNLYQYARSSPLVALDPGGRLTIASKIMTVLGWRTGPRGALPGLNSVFDAVFGETYEFNDDENEMPRPTYGVGGKMNEFYLAFLKTQDLPDGQWQQVDIPFQNAKDLLGIFVMASKYTLDTGWWLNRSTDVRVSGHMDVCREGNKYFAKDLKANWQWHDRIDGNSAAMLIAEGKSAAAVLVEGVWWDLTQDKVRDVDFYVIVNWVDDIGYTLFPPGPER